MVLDLICRYCHAECATVVLLMFECCLDILHGSLGILVSLTSLDLTDLQQDTLQPIKPLNHRGWKAMVFSFDMCFMRYVTM